MPASLQVPDGNEVEFHAYAAGVQIHTATNFTDRFDEAGLDLYAFRLGPRVGHGGHFVDVLGDEVVVEGVTKVLGCSSALTFSSDPGRL